MSRRSIAAGTAFVLALAPALASAHSTPAPRATIRGGHAAPAPSTTYHAVAPRTTNGITAAFTCTASDARNFACDATSSSDTNSTITGYTFDFGDGSTPTTNTTGTTTYSYTRAGTYTVTLTIIDSAGNSATVTKALTTLGSDYTTYGPTRILDTRDGTGQGGTVAKIPADSAIKLKIGGNGTIPTGVTAVILNLTAADETKNGDIIAYPDGGTLPVASNLDFAAGQIIPALSTVKVGADGYIDLYNQSAGTTDLIADASGYFTQTSASGYTPLTPARILDTRTTTGGHDSPAAADGAVTLTIAGADGGALPTTGITAVALNLTATDETKNGDIIAYPDGGTLPVTSNLNYASDQNIANYAVVPVGSDGKIDLYNQSTGTAEFVADVSGYFTTSSTSSYVPVIPYRSLDTRTLEGNTGTCADCPADDTGLTSLLNNATAYAVTATVTNTAAAGDVIIYPAGATMPTASNIDWAAGDTLANADYAEPSSTGFYLYNQSTGTANFIVDEDGYYSDK